MISIRKLIFLMAVALVGTSWFAKPSFAEFKFIAGPIPPYAVIERGQIKGGVHIETLTEIARRVNIPLEIQILPWARAYSTIINQDDYIIAMMVRTPAREDLMTWILPVIPERIVFWTLDGDALTVDQAAGLKRVGVQLDTPMQALAAARGLTNLEVVSDPNTLAKLLIRGRIDAMVNQVSMARYSVMLEGSDPNRLVPGEDLFSSHVYIAGSRNLADHDFSAWEAAFDAMKADGTFAEILTRYGLDAAVN